MEALISRSDAQLAQQAINRGWNFSEEEEDEIKKCALSLVRSEKWRQKARGVALCVAMKGQNIKLGKMAQDQEKPAGPQISIQANSVTVSPDAIRGLLALQRDLQARKAPPALAVIENTPLSLSAQAPEGAGAVAEKNP